MYRIGLAAAVFSLASSAAFAASWPEIDPAHRALTAPRLDPTASAEALLWHVKITDSTTLDEPQTILEHHVRIKVFTDRGREEQSRVDLPYVKEARVRDVEGRTIAADGTITELRGGDVFDRTLVETSGVTVKVKSFVLPAVTAGAIIEYRWREIRDNSVAFNLELPFQRDIPTHLVRYQIKPLPVRELGYRMKTQSFNFRVAAETGKGDPGYSYIQLRDVPARTREPFMPPNLAVTPWMLIYYADVADATRPPEEYWKRFGRELHDAYKPLLRATGALRSTVKDTVAAGTSPDDTVDALVRYVRGSIRREDLDAPEVSRRKRTNANDTLARGTGDGLDVTILFAALAEAAGLEVRLAMLPDRSMFFSEPSMKQPYFIEHVAAAVRVGERWRFVDPAGEHTSRGQLAWRHEGQYALLLHDETPSFVAVPVAAAAASLRRRSGTLTLGEDGTLAGDVRLEYTGHAAERLRTRDAAETTEGRQRVIREAMQRDVPNAEVSGITVENLDDPDAPYVVRFTLRAPGYAQRAGSRLILQPGVLQRGAETTFTAAARQHALHFPFAYTEEDTLAITLPAGWQLAASESPKKMGIDGGATAAYARTVTFDTTSSRLHLARSLMFGGTGRLAFQREVYLGIKGFFDTVHEGDLAAIVVERAAAIGKPQ